MQPPGPNEVDRALMEARQLPAPAPDFSEADPYSAYGVHLFPGQDTPLPDLKAALDAKAANMRANTLDMTPGLSPEQYFEQFVAPSLKATVLPGSLGGAYGAGDDQIPMMGGY
jgi:hypothetical protein